MAQAPQVENEHLLDPEFLQALQHTVDLKHGWYAMKQMHNDIERHMGILENLDKNPQGYGNIPAETNALIKGPYERAGDGRPSIDNVGPNSASNEDIARNRLTGSYKNSFEQQAAQGAALAPGAFLGNL